MEIIIIQTIIGVMVIIGLSIVLIQIIEIVALINVKKSIKKAFDDANNNLNNLKK